MGSMTNRMNRRRLTKVKMRFSRNRNDLQRLMEMGIPRHQAIDPGFMARHRRYGWQQGAQIFVESNEVDWGRLPCVMHAEWITQEELAKRYPS